MIHFEALIGDSIVNGLVQLSSMKPLLCQIMKQIEFFSIKCEKEVFKAPCFELLTPSDTQESIFSYPWPSYPHLLVLFSL